MGVELMDFKEVFNKQIPPLPTQMHANNQTKLSMSMICVVSLTGINSSHTPLCISFGPFTVPWSLVGNRCPFSTKITMLEGHGQPQPDCGEERQLGHPLAWGWQCQGSTRSRQSLPGCPGHPFSLAASVKCRDLRASLPAGRQSTGKTVVSHRLF